MFLLSPTLLFLSSLLSLAHGQDTDTCDPAHNGLRTGTLQYSSDCNATTWCNNGKCDPKRCRKDEFPLGWPDSIDLPTRCNSSSFCPDEGSECLLKMSVGSACQFDRDGACMLVSGRAWLCFLALERGNADVHCVVGGGA